MDDPSPQGTDLAYLLVRLEQAVEETGSGFGRGMKLIAAFFFVMAVMYGLMMHAWSISAVVAAVGVAMLLLGQAVSRKLSPSRMRPVLDAVRDEPARAELVRHYQTSDSRRIFVTEWIEIRTRDHRMVVKAKDDWQRLLGALERRCPGATLER